MPSIKAALIGDGPEKRLQSRIEVSSGLGSNIVLTGEQSHADVIKCMQKAKIFLHPSSYEGFGIVCIEALAAGATVISFVQPMEEKIDNWHIVAGKEQMIEKSLEILRLPDSEHKRVIPYTIAGSVEMIARLFSL
jgi:glycosyltransferase involved in cell wall biosynthesis